MDIYLDSRRIKNGDIYISLDGNKYKGDRFIKDALNNGASFIMSNNKKSKFYYPNLKKDLNKILIDFYKINFNIKIIGITGTNGKSTLAYSLHMKLLELGIKSRLITCIKGIKESYLSELTTPRNDDLIRIIKDAIDNHIEYLIMEVSSIGYKEFRINDIPIHLGIITNLEVDHLDYHHNLYSYHEAKIEYLFKAKKILYQMKNYNIFDDISRILNVKFKDNKYLYPTGREEIINHSPLIIIDYPHTTSSYKYILEKYRKLNKRIIVVFGLGGDRDKSKRREIGNLVYLNSTRRIITNDNPRNENEMKIIRMTLKDHPNDFKVILNRKEAIRYALSILNKNDILLVLGKGHEDYMLIKNKKIKYSDKDVLLEYFKNE